MLSWYPEWEYPIAAAQLVFTMLGIGLTLAPRDFLQLARDPRGLTAGLATQYLLAPLAALLLVGLFNVEAGFAIGLFLIAAVPGGSLSNIYTVLARGNVALSIALTAVTTVAALFMTPLLLELLSARPDGRLLALPMERILFDIGVLLLLPLAVGMAGGRLIGAWRAPLSKWFLRAGFFFVALIVVGALGSGRIDIAAFGWKGPLLVIGLALTLLWASRLLARLLRTPPGDNTAVAMEATCRNANLALLLAVSLFPAGDAEAAALGSGAIFAILFFGGTGIVIGLIAALEARWLSLRRERRHADEPVDTVAS